VFVAIPAGVTVFVLIAAALTGELRDRLAGALVAFPVMVALFYSIERARRGLRNRVQRRRARVANLTAPPNAGLPPFWIMAPVLWLVVFGSIAATTYVLGNFTIALVLGLIAATGSVGSLGIYASNAKAEGRH
jgi:hypothetical protein